MFSIQVAAVNDQQEFKHPIFSSSYTKWTEGTSQFKFRIINSFDTQTLPFRLTLSSNLSWFDPHTFLYVLAPDGFDEKGNPYWNIPPLESNESVELTFIVYKRVGLPEEVNINATPIDRWSNNCSINPLKNYSDQNIITPLNSTIYYFLTANNSKLLLVHLNDYNTYAVLTAPLQSTDPNDYVFDSDPSQISDVISSYISDSAINIPSLKTNTNYPVYAITEANQTKNSSEYECTHLTGMDRFPCTNRESCRYACYSVQVCADIGQGGWDFIDVIQSYNKTKTSVNSQIESSLNVTTAFANDPSYDSANAALSSMIELNRAETSLNNHPMFTSYGFCSIPDFSIPLEMEAKRQLLDYLDSKCIYGQKDILINESISASAKLSGLLIRQKVIIPTSPKTIVPIVNISNNNQTNQENSCCVGSSCKDQIGKIFNLCWQWWGIGILFLLIVGASIFFIKRK